MKRFIILIAIAAFTLAACAADEGTDDMASDELPVADAGNETTPAGEEPIPVEPNEGIGDGASAPGLPVVSPNLAAETEAAVADLQNRLGGDVLVEVLVAHEVTWPDGALGCPDPDKAYAQVLVDGYRIELSDGSDTFIYHGELGEAPFLCENVVDTSSSDDAAATSDAAAYPQAVSTAASDLANRLGVASSAIRVVSHEEVDWPDGSLGCPQPDMSYRQVIVNGTLTVLEVDGVEYRYHAGGSREPFLCVQAPKTKTTTTKLDPDLGSGADDE